MNPTTLERRSDRELVIARRFAAPPRLVFEAWTRPELLKRWWAPSSRAALFDCESDVRVGGAYRFVFGKRADQAMAFSGTYREVVPYSRLVFTQIFEPMREVGEAVITATFTARGDATDFVLSSVYPSKAALDGALASGMAPGMRETFEQLAALLEPLAALLEPR